MNKEALRNYLVELSTEGYAKDPGTQNEDGSTTIKHKSGDGRWTTIDTYWGGEPYAGCETVLLENKPVWSLVYYGSVDTNETDVDDVYKMLRKGLEKTDSFFPVRGPKEISDGRLTYQNHWEGDIEKFKGEEWILRDDVKVYTATYFGGLVNQRSG